MNTQIMTLPEVNSSNMKLAQQKITEFAASRKLVINREFDIEHVNLSFSSKSQEKLFRHSMLRVFNRPSMRAISFFLRKLSQNSSCIPIKLDYSPEEKAIKQFRKEWKFLHGKAEEARVAYKTLKGDFYKS